MLNNEYIGSELKLIQQLNYFFGIFITFYYEMSQIAINKKSMKTFTLSID